MTAPALAFKRPVSAFGTVLDYLHACFAGAAEGQQMARRYEELSRLSDEALAARGLTRNELAHAVVTGRIGR